MAARKFEAPIVATLVLAGLVVILTSVGGDSWPVLAGWTFGWLVVGGALRVARGLPRVRLGLAVALLPACVVLTWEGGLFFLPAAVVLTGFEAARLASRHDTPG